MAWNKYNFILHWWSNATNSCIAFSGNIQLLCGNCDSTSNMKVVQHGINSKGLWCWYTTFNITGFLDFVHHLVFWTGNTVFEMGNFSILRWKSWRHPLIPGKDTVSETLCFLNTKWWKKSINPVYSIMCIT
jgi:hypothetical protein